MNVQALFPKVNTFVFDVDGVLTDCSLLVYESGEQVRRMHVKDGYALQLAVKKGYHVWVISGANSEGVKQRLQKLGIVEIHMGVHDKVALLKRLMQKYDVTASSVLFMGDDMPDYFAMQLIGVAAAPADAVADIKTIATYISHHNGGEGCVRDVIEKVMKLRGDWDITAGIASK